MTARESAHRWIIDVIEEDSASIEVDGGRMINVPRAMLPAGAREGHVLRVTLEIDEAGTQAALEASRAQVEQGRKASRKLDPGGDIAL
jgi:hypothetical protein